MKPIIKEFEMKRMYVRAMSAKVLFHCIRKSQKSYQPQIKNIESFCINVL